MNKKDQDTLIHALKEANWKMIDDMRKLEKENARLKERIEQLIICKHFFIKKTDNSCVKCGWAGSTLAAM